MNLLLIAIIVFLLVIWVLVFLLLIAKNKLTPDGKANIVINGEKTIEHDKGETLLNTLNDEKIYMPSACGGCGTCGTCKGKVHSGGGDVLPTELPHLTKSEIADNYRLFCQVKVKDDMEIELPSEIFNAKKWLCEVVSNRNVSTFIKELVVRLPDNEVLDFKSGSYVQVDVPKYKINFNDFDIDDKYREDWDKLSLFKLRQSNNETVVRAYSMANHPSESNIITLNVRFATPPFDKKKKRLMNVPAGICSSYIFSLKPGDKITISGPYGDFFVKDTDSEMMFIGGGAGMAPMRSHIFDLFYNKHTSRKVSFWYGGRSLRELFYVDDFEKIAKENDNFSFNIALSEPLPTDNWKGMTGFIHDAIFENYLKNHKNPEDIEYYICGPPLMLKAVLNMLDNLGVPNENILYDNFGG